MFLVISNRMPRHDRFSARGAQRNDHKDIVWYTTTMTGMSDMRQIDCGRVSRGSPFFAAIPLDIVFSDTALSGPDFDRLPESRGTI
jgi:hypothetical protein